MLPYCLGHCRKRNLEAVKKAHQGRGDKAGFGAQQGDQVFDAQSAFAGSPYFGNGRTTGLQPGGGPGGEIQVVDDYLVALPQIQCHGGQIVRFGGTRAYADIRRGQIVGPGDLRPGFFPAGLVEFSPVHAQDFVPPVLRQSFDYCSGRNALGRGIQIGSVFERGKIELSGSGSEQGYCLSYGGLSRLKRFSRAGRPLN